MDIWEASGRLIRFNNSCCLDSINLTRSWRGLPYPSGFPKKIFQSIQTIDQRLQSSTLSMRCIPGRSLRLIEVVIPVRCWISCRKFARTGLKRSCMGFTESLALHASTSNDLQRRNQGADFIASKTPKGPVRVSSTSFGCLCWSPLTSARSGNRITGGYRNVYSPD